MNLYFSHLIDNWLEYTVGSVRGWVTPNQYKPFQLEEMPGLDEFYAIPNDPPAVQFTPTHPIRTYRQRFHFKFRSPLTSPHPRNNIVYGLADLTTEKAQAVLVFLHGHSMNNFAPIEWVASHILPGGIDVYYLSLPYHMQRAPLGTWSGQYSLGADVGRFIQAFRQGVMDTRMFISWLQQNRELPIAVAGISLGGFTANMTAVVDERISAAISILGGASLAQIPWAGPSYAYIRRDLRRAGVDLSTLEKYWSILSPAQSKPRIPMERVLLLGGLYDTVVTPDNIHQLWHAWDHPTLEWYPCGHASLFLLHKRAGERIADFLQQVIL